MSQSCLGWAAAGTVAISIAVALHATPAEGVEQSASSPASTTSILKGEGLPATDREARAASSGDPMFPMRVDGEADAQTRQAYQDALREYYQYRKSGLEHRQRVFAWQHMSSIAIFVVVLALVSCGIYFAALQFHRDLPARGVRHADPVASPSTAATSSVEISASGVKVSSPVLGVIILVISLAFFYLYLAVVYPIREIF
jgi:hypothetical protein